MPQVAISTDFLRAFAQIPRGQQKKVRAFVEKFKADPAQASIHYEAIHDMDDSKVRTVRIDQAYRAIVIHPPAGDVYLMVWVDHHDEAMAWARHKHFEVNPRTGSFQVWESVHAAAPSTDSAPRSMPVETVSTSSIPENRLFSGRTDDELLLFGVPDPLLPAVRALRVEADLDRLSRYLPQEATDALYMLGAGYSVDETIEELARSVPAAMAEPVDTTDFAAALERPSTQRQFKLIADDAELAEMLDAPLEQWRIFLHPSQRRVVELDSNGSARVLGGAGTGKTVVAMHRARFLAARPGFLAPGERLLFTTFTRNLAADIRRSLDLLCGPERERIDVQHLHGVAHDVLTKAGVKPRIAQDDDVDLTWSDVMAAHPDAAYSQSFYREEWEKVVQAHDINDEKEYLRTRRVGRGTPLTRAQRKDVWKIFSAYRERLNEHGWMEYADLVREARLQLQQSGRHPYRAVVADEVQDFRQADLDLLRALAPTGPNDIYVVGDAHQRIYGHQASLLRAGINIRGRRSRHLRINYRTTQQIRLWAMAILEGLDIDDLDEGKDDARGYHSLRTGVPPVVKQFATSDTEAAFIVSQIRQWVEQGASLGDVCVVARTGSQVERHYRPVLTQASIDTELVKRNADSADRTKVRLATMHRVKGLEFRYVLIAGVQKGSVPLELGDNALPDPAARDAHVRGERHLLYVAATRARDELVVTGYGKKSGLL
jgi:superfamily I DNA/RNA helicase